MSMSDQDIVETAEAGGSNAPTQVFSKLKRYWYIVAIVLAAIVGGSVAGVLLSNQNNQEPTLPPNEEPEPTEPPIPQTLPSYPIHSSNVQPDGSEQPFALIIIAIGGATVGSAMKHGIRLRTGQGLNPFNTTDTITAVAAAQMVELRKDFEISSSGHEGGYPSAFIEFDYGWFLPEVPDSLESVCVRSVTFGNGTVTNTVKFSDLLRCQGMCEKNYNHEFECMQLGENFLHNITLDLSKEAATSGDICDSFPLDSIGQHAETLCTYETAIHNLDDLRDAFAKLNPTTNNGPRSYSAIRAVFEPLPEPDDDNNSEENVFPTTSPTRFQVPTQSPTTSPTSHVVDFGDHTFEVEAGMSVEIVSERDFKRFHSKNNEPLFRVHPGGELRLEGLHFENSDTVVEATDAQIHFEDCTFIQLPNSIAVVRGGILEMNGCEIHECVSALQLADEVEITIIGCEFDAVTTFTNCGTCNMDIQFTTFGPPIQSNVGAVTIVNDGVLTVSGVSVRRENPKQVFGGPVAPVIGTQKVPFVMQPNSAMCDYSGTLSNPVGGQDTIGSDISFDGCKSLCDSDGTGIPDCDGIWYDFTLKDCSVCPSGNEAGCSFPCHERNFTIVHTPEVQRSFSEVPSVICPTAVSPVEVGQVANLKECFTWCSYQPTCQAIVYDVAAPSTSQCKLLQEIPHLRFRGICAAASGRMFVPTSGTSQFEVEWAVFRNSEIQACFTPTTPDLLTITKSSKDLSLEDCISFCKLDPECSAVFGSELVNSQVSCRFLSDNSMEIGNACAEPGLNSTLFVNTIEVFPKQHYADWFYCSPPSSVLVGQDKVVDVRSQRLCEVECDQVKCVALWFDVMENTCYLFGDTLWTDCDVDNVNLRVVYGKTSIVIPESTGEGTISPETKGTTLAVFHDIVTSESCANLCEMVSGCQAFDHNAESQTCELVDILDGRPAQTFLANDMNIYNDNYIIVHGRCLPEPLTVVGSAPSANYAQCLAMCEIHPDCTGVTVDTCHLLTDIVAMPCQTGEIDFAISPTNQFRDRYESLPNELCLDPGSQQIYVSLEVEATVVTEEGCEEACFEEPRCRSFTYQGNTECNLYETASITSCVNAEDIRNVYLAVDDFFYRLEEDFVPGDEIIQVVTDVARSRQCTSTCDVFPDCVSVLYNSQTLTCTLLTGQGMYIPPKVRNGTFDFEIDVTMLTRTSSYPLTSLTAGTKGTFCNHQSLPVLATLPNTQLAPCHAACDAYRQCLGVEFDINTGMCRLADETSICMDEVRPANKEYYLSFRNFISSDRQSWNLGLPSRGGVCIDRDASSSIGLFDETFTTAHCETRCNQMSTCNGFSFELFSGHCELFQSVVIDRSDCSNGIPAREAVMYSEADFTEIQKKVVVGTPTAVLGGKTKEECAALCHKKFDCSTFSLTVGRESLTPGNVVGFGSALYSVDGREVARLEANGNFVVYGRDGSIMWSSPRATQFLGSSVQLSEQGNFQVLDAAGAVLFEKENSGSTDQVELQVDRFGLVLRDTVGNLDVWRLPEPTGELVEDAFGKTCFEYISQGICCGGGACAFQDSLIDSFSPPPCEACKGKLPPTYTHYPDTCFMNTPLTTVENVDGSKDLAKCSLACNKLEQCKSFQFHRTQKRCTLHGKTLPQGKRGCDGEFRNIDTYSQTLESNQVGDDLKEFPKTLEIGDLYDIELSKYAVKMAGDGRLTIIDKQTQQRWWESIQPLPGTKLVFSSTELEFALVDANDNIVWEVPITQQFDYINLTLSNSGILTLTGTLSQFDSTLQDTLSHVVEIWAAGPVKASQASDVALVGTCRMFNDDAKLVDSPLRSVFQYYSEFEFTKIPNRCGTAPINIPALDTQDLPLELCKRLCHGLPTCSAFEYDENLECKLHESRDFSSCLVDVGDPQVDLYIDYSYVYSPIKHRRWVEQLHTGPGGFNPVRNMTSLTSIDINEPVTVSQCKEVCSQQASCYGFELRLSSAWNPYLWKSKPLLSCHFFSESFNTTLNYNTTTQTRTDKGSSFLFVNLDLSPKFAVQDPVVCMDDESTIDGPFHSKSLRECLALMYTKPFAVAVEYGHGDNPHTAGECILKNRLPLKRVDECKSGSPLHYKRKEYDVYMDARATYDDTPPFNLPRAVATQMPPIFSGQDFNSTSTYESCRELCTSLPVEACAMFLFTGGHKGEETEGSSIFKKHRIMNDASLLCLEVDENDVVRSRRCDNQNSQRIDQVGDRFQLWGTNLCLQSGSDSKVLAKECSVAESSQEWIIDLDGDGTIRSTSGSCLGVTSPVSWKAPSSLLDLLRASSVVPDTVGITSQVRLTTCNSGSASQRWQWTSRDLVIQDEARESVSLPFAELVWTALAAVRNDRMAFTYHFRTQTIGMGGSLLYGNCLDVVDPDFKRVVPWSTCDLSGSQTSQKWNFDDQRNMIESSHHPGQCLQGKAYFVPRSDDVCDLDTNGENVGRRRLLDSSLLGPATQNNDPVTFFGIMFSFIFVTRPTSLELGNCDSNVPKQRFFADHTCHLFGATETEPSPVESAGNKGKCLHVNADKSLTLRNCDAGDITSWQYDIKNRKISTTRNPKTCLGLNVKGFGNETIPDNHPQVPVVEQECYPFDEPEQALQYWFTSDTGNGARGTVPGTVLESPLQSGIGNMFRLEAQTDGSGTRITTKTVAIGSKPSIKQMWRLYESPEIRASPYKFISRKSVSIRPFDQLKLLEDPEVQFHLWFFSQQASLAKWLLFKAEALNDRAVEVSEMAGEVLSSTTAATSFVAGLSGSVDSVGDMVDLVKSNAGGIEGALKRLSRYRYVGKLFKFFHLMFKKFRPQLEKLSKFLDFVNLGLAKTGAVAGTVSGAMAFTSFAALGPAAGLEKLANVLVRVSKCSYDIGKNKQVDIILRTVGSFVDRMEEVMKIVKSAVKPLFELQRVIKSAFASVSQISAGFRRFISLVLAFDWFKVFVNFSFEIPVIGRILMGDILSGISWIVSAVSVLFFGISGPAIDLVLGVFVDIISSAIKVPDLFPYSNNIGINIENPLGQIGSIEDIFGNALEKLEADLTSLLEKFPDMGEECNMGEGVSEFLPEKPDIQEMLGDANVLSPEEETGVNGFDTQEGTGRNLAYLDGVRRRQRNGIHFHSHMYEHGPTSSFGTAQLVRPRSSHSRHLLSIPKILARDGTTISKFQVMKQLIAASVTDALNNNESSKKAKRKNAPKRRTEARIKIASKQVLMKKPVKGKFKVIMTKAMDALRALKKKLGSKLSGDGVTKVFLKAERAHAGISCKVAVSTQTLLIQAKESAKKGNPANSGATASSTSSTFVDDEVYVVFTHVRIPETSWMEDPVVCIKKLPKQLGLPIVVPKMFLEKQQRSVLPSVFVEYRTPYTITIEYASVSDATRFAGKDLCGKFISNALPISVEAVHGTHLNTMSKKNLLKKKSQRGTCPKGSIRVEFDTTKDPELNVQVVVEAVAESTRTRVGLPSTALAIDLSNLVKVKKTIHDFGEAKGSDNRVNLREYKLSHAQLLASNPISRTMQYDRYIGANPVGEVHFGAHPELPTLEAELDWRHYLHVPETWGGYLWPDSEWFWPFGTDGLCENSSPEYGTDDPDPDSFREALNTCDLNRTTAGDDSLCPVGVTYCSPYLQDIDSSFMHHNLDSKYLNNPDQRFSGTDSVQRYATVCAGNVQTISENILLVYTVEHQRCEVLTRETEWFGWTSVYLDPETAENSGSIGDNAKIEVKAGGKATAESQYSAIVHIFDWNSEYFGSANGCKNHHGNFVVGNNLWNDQLQPFNSVQMLEEKLCVLGWDVVNGAVEVLMNECDGWTEVLGVHSITAEACTVPGALDLDDQEAQATVLAEFASPTTVLGSLCRYMQVYYKMFNPDSEPLEDAERPPICMPSERTSSMLARANAVKKVGSSRRLEEAAESNAVDELEAAGLMHHYTAAVEGVGEDGKGSLSAILNLYYRALSSYRELQNTFRQQRTFHYLNPATGRWRPLHDRLPVCLANPLANYDMINGVVEHLNQLSFADSEADEVVNSLMAEQLIRCLANKGSLHELRNAWVGKDEGSAIAQDEKNELNEIRQRFVQQQVSSPISLYPDDGELYIPPTTLEQNTLT